MIYCAHLKTHTAVWHAKTETALQAKRVFSDNFSEQEYCILLEQLYRAYTCLEKAICAAPENIQQVRREFYALKSELLEQDLVAMQNNIPTVQEIDTFFASEHEVLGALYVLRGADLGGKIIYKRLSAQVTKWQHSSLLFYAEANQSPDNWQAFCSALDSFGTEKEYLEQALEGAIKAYQVFHRAA